MDGDSAPVEELARVCADHDALLVLDEAHAVLAPHAGPLPCEALRVGTLSEAPGSLGGFVAGARVMTELLVKPGPALYFHHRAGARRRRRGLGRAGESCVPPKGRP